MQIVITACFDPEDEDYDGGDDEDEPDEDVEENDIVEATVEVELLEQDSLSGETHHKTHKTRVTHLSLSLKFCQDRIDGSSFAKRARKRRAP